MSWLETLRAGVEAIRRIVEAAPLLDVLRGEPQVTWAEAVRRTTAKLRTILSPFVAIRR